MTENLTMLYISIEHPRQAYCDEIRERAFDRASELALLNGLEITMLMMPVKTVTADYNGAEMYNQAVRTANDEDYDYISFLTGDQIIPEEHPVAMTRFLDDEPICGLVNGLVHFPYSHKKMLVNGIIRNAYRPMVFMDTEEKNQWLYAHMLPNGNQGGIDSIEVDKLGLNGAVIPRTVFGAKWFKFSERWAGLDQGYNIGTMIKSHRYGIYIIPWVNIKTRYYNGEMY